MGEYAWYSLGEYPWYIIVRMVTTLKTSPPLMKPDDADKRIRRIRQHSRKRYGRSKEEVDAEILSRYNQEEQAEAEATQESYFG